MTQSVAVPVVAVPDKPSEEGTVAALAQVVGRALARELWELAVTELNLSRPITNPAHLRQVAEHLMTIGDASRVAGRALRVQVITYQALAGN
jgi:hypothetical protein